MKITGSSASVCQKKKVYVYIYFNIFYDASTIKIIVDNFSQSTSSTNRCSSNGNTTNAFNHLKLKHNVTHDELIKKQKEVTSPTTSTHSQRSISATLFNATPYPSNSDRHKKITPAIGHFLAKDMHPINTVEGKGFKKLTHNLDKRYSLPSRHHFSRVVLPNMSRRSGRLHGNDRSLVQPHNVAIY